MSARLGALLAAVATAGAVYEVWTDTFALATPGMWATATWFGTTALALAALVWPLRPLSSAWRRALAASVRFRALRSWKQSGEIT